MCKCIVGILLADFITLSLLYTSFIELNINDDHYNLIKLFSDDYDFEGKYNAKVTMISYLIALVIHTLAIIIKALYHLICCCSCDKYNDDIVLY